jgi:ABC-type molybdate transport system substrate-binding protein
LRVFASNGVKAAIQALTPQLEKASGGPLAIEFSTTADLRQRIEKGEPFDVAILTDDAMSALAKAASSHQCRQEWRESALASATAKAHRNQM